MDYKSKLFADFTTEYERFDPRPVQHTKTRGAVLGRLIGIGVYYLIIFAAFVVSASHTIPLFISTVPEDFQFLFINREGVGYAAFIMVEGFLFRIGHVRAQRATGGQDKWYLIAFGIALLVITVANWYGVFFKWFGFESATKLPFLMAVLSFLTAGLLASLPGFVAYVGGSILVDQEREQERKERDADAKWREEDALWRERFQKAWLVSRQYGTTIKIERQEARGVQTLNLPSSTMSSTENSDAQNVQPVQIAFSESEKKVIEAINTDPSAANLSQVALAKFVGVSAGTVNSALKKKRLMEQQ